MKLTNRFYTFYGWKEEEGQEVELLPDIGVEIDWDLV
jgi:hypothetical protein